MSPNDRADAAATAAGEAAEEPPEAAASGNAVELLLRAPASLLARFEEPRPGRQAAGLAAIGFVGYLAYALVVASFAGDMQWWASPLKILAGIAFCGAICFPSLYILVCLSGAQANLSQVAGLLLSVLALSGIFLAGFAPVAWVFSRSSTLVSFIGAIHILVWLVAILASVRVIHVGLRRWRARAIEWSALWVLVFVVTVLQMATVLRPIVGPATTLYESERRFFLQQWGLTIKADTTSE